MEFIKEVRNAVDKNKLVGRERELISLGPILETKSDYSLTIVTGEAGVGKTTLLQVFADLASNSGRFEPFWMDCRNMEFSVEGLTDLLGRFFLQKGDLKTICAKIAMLPSKPLLFFDAFEHIGQKGQTALEVLSSLVSPYLPVIIAGRQTPIPENVNVVLLPLKPFGSKLTVDFLLKNSIPVELTVEVYTVTQGNPLLLNLFSWYYLNRQSEQALYTFNEGQTEFIYQVVAEVADTQLLPLIEATSLVSSFSKELLETMLGSRINQELFLSLSELSFIATSPNSFWMHELVAKAFAITLKKDAPEKYLSYKKAAFQYYSNKAKQSKKWQAQELRLKRMYLCENELARSIMFAQMHLESFSGVFPTSVEDIAQIPEIWLAWVQSTALLPQNSGEAIEKGVKDTERLMKLDPDFFRVIKDDMGKLKGYHTTFPACKETIDYLLQSPAMAEYFEQLPTKELKKIQQQSPKDSKIHVIRHVVIPDPADMETRSIILQDIAKSMRNGIHYITSIPQDVYQILVDGLGFRQIKGIYDYTFPEPIPLVELDFQTEDIDLWLERISLGSALPQWITILSRMSPKGWVEAVKDALEQLDQPKQLAQNPFSSLAAALSGGESSYLTKGLGEVLVDVLSDFTQRLLSNNNDQRTKGPTDMMLGEILIHTYFKRVGSREQVAEYLGLPTTTYYRYLHRAQDRIGELLRQEAEKMLVQRKQ